VSHGNSVKHILALLSCLCATFTSLATTTPIDVGGTQLTIPSPVDFAPVTPQMTRLVSQLDAFITPVNQRLLWFVEEQELDKAKSGRVPSFTRVFSVQCAKKDVQTFRTKSEFAKVKKLIREQNDELIRRVEKLMPGYLDQINKGIRKQFDWDGTLGVNGYLPLSGLEETDRSVSFPMLVKYNSQTRDGGKQFGADVVVVTFLYVKGKIIFLYCNALENDLVWARAVSKEWASAVVSANPSDAATAAREAAQFGGGFEWKRVPTFVWIVFALGVAGSIVKWSRKRR
jgi:hypothetical protein